MMVTTDYLSAGNVIGEWGMLTGIARNSSCTCEDFCPGRGAYHLTFEGGGGESGIIGQYKIFSRH